MVYYFRTKMNVQNAPAFDSRGGCAEGFGVPLEDEMRGG